VYAKLTAESWIEWTVAAWAAAATYYAVITVSSSLRIAIKEWTSPWRVWQQRFFWTGPVYMLAPVGLSAVQAIINASSYVDALMGLAVIFGGYGYVRAYFSRLHDQQDHDRELAEIRHRAIETLAAAIEAKDGSTAGHLQRVKHHATRLAQSLGCSKEEIPTLEMAAVLHDVGKVGVPDYILMKPGRLTDHEFKEIANHTTVGAAIVEAAQFPNPVGKIVLSHHEHWDGSGYPNALKGEEIPRLARILTVVDCFDALITDRPYRPALSIDQAVDLMRQQRGKIFDPKILDTFLDQIPEGLSDLKKDLEAEHLAAVSAHRTPIEVSQNWIDEGGDEHDSALRRKTVRQLTKAPDKLIAFYEILDMLGADLNFEKGLKECLRVLKTAIPYDKAGVFVLEKDQYILLAGDGFPGHCVSRLTMPAEHGIVSQAAIRRHPMAADTCPSEVPGETLPRYLDDIKSCIVAPLVEEELIVGALVLAATEPGRFADEQAHSLGLITRKLARTLLSSKAVQKVFLEAETDAVTNLPNARAAFRKLEDEVKRAQREGQTVGVLFMDINGLKPVNDSYGHGAGDQLLIETARKLKERLRTYDFAGRVGGDEFLAILPGISKDGLPGAIESLKNAIADNAVKVAEGVYAQTTISIGATLFPDDSVDPEELVYLSDQRMYEDKLRSRQGRGRDEVSLTLVEAASSSGE
jgi:diguanylate cyclase (GGDEF)-like protein/putative nucleotidyltransferase with HDIG domain